MIAVLRQIYPALDSKCWSIDMKQRFKILALFLGVILSKSLGGVYCEDSYYCTEYKLGVGAQWGVHNSKTIDDLNVLGSIFVDANIWNKWLYFALKSHFGLGKAWITNIEKQDSKKDAIYDDISVRFALGLPLNVVFSHTPSIAMSEPILLYLILSVGVNDYGYSANMPSQKRNAIGLGLAGSGIINDYWKLEYALEYGYIYNAHISLAIKL